MTPGSAIAELATKTDLQNSERRLETVIENATLKVTLRMGGMLVVAVGVVTALEQLLS